MKIGGLRPGALIAAAGLIGSLVAVAQPAGAAAKIVRLAGPDRYATAVAVSQHLYPGTTDEVYVTTGENFPDALSAGPAAASVDAPVLLVQKDKVPDVTLNEIKRLSPSRITVVGGPAVIGDAVIATLSGLTAKVVRLFGADRVETALKVSQDLFSPGAPIVFVATGSDFQSALMAGSAAALFHVPLILIGTGDSLPASVQDEMSRLSADFIFLIGAPGTFPDSMLNELATHTNASAVRISNADTFERSAALFSQLPPGLLSGGSGVILATAANFPDALAAAPLAGAGGGNITYLSGSDCVPGQILQEINRLNPDSIFLIGGPNALSDNVAALKSC